MTISTTRKRIAIPPIPASGPDRELAIRAIAEAVVDQIGALAAMVLASEIDEAAADQQRSPRTTADTANGEAVA